MGAEVLCDHVVQELGNEVEFSPIEEFRESLMRVHRVSSIV